MISGHMRERLLREHGVFEPQRIPPQEPEPMEIQKPANQPSDLGNSVVTQPNGEQQ